MGLRSKLRKAVGSLPGMNVVQKVVGKDPIAQQILKNDPLARQVAMDHGLVAQRPAAQPMEGPGQAQPAPQAMQRAVPWQEERMAAIRARFGRPAPATAMRPATQMPAATAMPAAPAATTMPGAMSASVQPAAMPGQMPASPGTAMAGPANPAAADIADYTKSWDMGMSGNGNPA